ncbi:RHS repeat-associated core domain-containing protein [Pseudomonas putida]|uniref:RHS repeat-associated core domain-containing protein n=1 Tax=Pseudomonas putida TaxID=303 RepID=UPI00336500F1
MVWVGGDQLFCRLHFATVIALEGTVYQQMAECSSDELHDNVYTAYGDSPDNDQLVGLLGFNGEARERALGWSLLGRGYRAYNPGLMRFHSPDTAAPEDAGINPYVYCGGNPVNWRDPSGHYGVRHSMEAPYIPPKPMPKADWRSWLGWAVGPVFAVISFMFMPPIGLTLAFAMGASSLVIDVAAVVVGAVGLMTGGEAINNWAFWLGIASAVTTLGVMAHSRFAAKAAARKTAEAAVNAELPGKLFASGELTTTTTTTTIKIYPTTNNTINVYMTPNNYKTITKAAPRTTATLDFSDNFILKRNPLYDDVPTTATSSNLPETVMVNSRVEKEIFIAASHPAPKSATLDIETKGGYTKNAEGKWNSISTFRDFRKGRLVAGKP